MQIKLFHDGNISFINLPVSETFIANAKSLPDVIGKYFIISADTVILPVEDLINTRVRLKGVINALSLMRQAHDGLINKRMPIIVDKLDSGQFKTVDGNSTLIVAIAAKWQSLPCVMFVNS